MTSTSKILKPKADRPVDPVTLSVIRAIHRASVKFGFPVFIVGATARIILLENIFGLNAGRATLDVDFAFALEDWDQFRALKQYLVTNLTFQESDRTAHRLLFNSPELAHKITVDLIPFGKIETESNKIAWPPDMNVIMNVAGFSDALSAAIPVEVSPGLTILVASIPGIAILKLFAWVDRGQENPKDAADLVSLLRGYHEAGNGDRIYEDASAALESNSFDIELTGAWLLGSDAAVLTSVQIRTELRTLLESGKRSRLAEDMARAMRGREDSLEYAQTLLEQFTKGFTS